MDGSVDGWTDGWMSRWMLVDHPAHITTSIHHTSSYHNIHSSYILISQHPFIVHPHITTSIHHYHNIHSSYILISQHPFIIHFIGNNLTFLRSVFRNPVFRGGTYSTKFIPQQYPDGFHGVSLSVEGTLLWTACYTIRCCWWWCWTMELNKHAGAD